MWQKLVEIGLVVYVVWPIAIGLLVGVLWVVCVIIGAITERKHNSELDRS